MTNICRTDLAMEAREQNTDISGVESEQHTIASALLTRVCVTSEEGAERLGKPMGTYITIEQKDLYEKSPENEPQLIECIAQQIGRLIRRIPAKGAVLVVGLGNRDLTPDSLGPRVVSEILITRHLADALPGVVNERMRPVCAIAPGVMGNTGMETGEVVRAVADAVQPSCVIVIDALAARSTQRILSTVQISDAGVTPGSGVGNHRDALTKDSLGVPVIALGIPMVVHASTILRDALERITGSDVHAETLLSRMDGANLVVTPVMIDEAVRCAASLLARAINMALHPSLTADELEKMRI